MLLRSTSFGPLWLPSLNYHRIHPHPDAQPFDRGVIDATPDELDQQMATLVQHFEPVTVNELSDHVSFGKPLPERPALVTFDDGYRECVTYALPILEKHGVRASFFVATSQIGDRKAFWWDRLSYCVRNARTSRIVLRYPVKTTLELSRGAEPCVRELLAIFKRSYDIDVDRFLDEVGEAAGVHFSREMDKLVADELVLDWQGVKALADAGMEIHSHTRTHRLLHNLRPDHVDAEVIGSRNDISDALGRAPRAISYPVGRPIVNRPWLVERVRSAGYELGFSIGLGAHPRQVNPFDIGRVCLDVGTRPAEFSAMLLHPGLLMARAA